MYPYSSRKDKEPRSESGKATNIEPGYLNEVYTDLEDVLDLIEVVIAEKKADAIYLEILLNQIKIKEEHEIVRQICLDEHKQVKVLTEIYLRYRNIKPSFQTCERVLKDTVLNNFEECIFKKLDSIDIYKKMHSCFEDHHIRDLIHSLMIEEYIHSVKFSYLYSKNK